MDFRFVDLFCGGGGSMSSAIAAHDFGVGIFDLCEVDPAYFAAGQKRFVQYTMQGKLF